MTADGRPQTAIPFQCRGRQSAVSGRKNCKASLQSVMNHVHIYQASVLAVLLLLYDFSSSQFWPMLDSTLSGTSNLKALDIVSTISGRT